MIATKPSIHAMQKKYFYHYSWTNYLIHCNRVLDTLLPVQPKDGFDFMVVVARGGLCVAGVLAQELKIKHIDCIRVISYNNEMQQLPEAKVYMSTPVAQYGAAGAKVLVVDDVVDTGKTMRIIKRALAHCHVTTAALCAKVGAEGEVDHVAEVLPRTKWVVFPWERPPTQQQVLHYYNSQEAKNGG